MRAIQDNQSELTPEPKGSDKYSWLKIGAFCGFLILFIILKSLFNGTFGAIGDDNDDVLRLVQIRDYLSGQSWFDTSQYRLGPGAGTDMHWSRIPDIPIIVLTHLFDIFQPQDKALSLAYSVWPPLTSFLLIFGILIGVKHYGEEKSALFALILLALFIGSFYRFMPGNIDHHNLQMGFMALSMGLTLDPKARFKTYFFAGLSVATAIAIGGEIYVFAAVICGYVAVSWALRGHGIKNGTAGYGLGLFLGLLTSFIVTIPPSDYGVIYCDALSSVTVLAGALGGLGLAALAFFAPRIPMARTALVRFIGLAGLGLVCGSALLLYAPQCLANPLASLPADVQTLWLQNVTEAKSIFRFETDKFSVIPMAIGAPIIALIGLGLRSRNIIKAPVRDNSARDGVELSATLFQFSLILAALVMTFYQIRYFPFAYVFSLVALSAWCARVFTNGKTVNSGSVAYLGCLILSVPISWTLPSLIKLPAGKVAVTITDETIADEQPKLCMSDTVIDVMNSLPQGLVSANPNITAPILMQTGHRALGGNYHRNWKGIQAQINISVSEPETSQQILKNMDVDYLYFCKASLATAIYVEHNSKGLFAELGRGNIPRYLKPVSGLEETGAQIFKVVKPFIQDGQ